MDFSPNKKKFVELGPRHITTFPLRVIRAVSPPPVGASLVRLSPHGVILAFSDNVSKDV